MGRCLQHLGGFSQKKFNEALEKRAYRLLRIICYLDRAS